ncbi:Transposase IS4 [Popillia japonica]|uniref:Transposase IS4 n=1 Tax=Popillia japonica TaxID=7064 RepID=A0AAW1K210_POPJA
MTMVSYIPKPNRQVILLSTLHHDDSIDPESGQNTKPEIITFYNSTKGEVDVVGQLSAKYNVARNTRKWPMLILYGLLNVEEINPFVIHKTNVNTNIQRRIFLKQLVKKLVMDYMKMRACSQYLPRGTRQLAAKISGTELPERVEVNVS